MEETKYPRPPPLLVMSREEETKPLFCGSSKPPKRRNDDSSSTSIEMRKKFVCFSEAERSRKVPTVIYVETPEIIHADAQHFMSLVQKLTGKDSNSLNITNNKTMPLSNTTSSSSSTAVAVNSDQVTKPGL